LKLKILIAALILSILSGCVMDHTQPKVNLDFSSTKNQNQFNGLYRNFGEPGGYLSSIIWKNKILKSNKSDNEIAHKDIQFIEILNNDTQFTVNAISNDCITYSQQYQAGQDFKISKGKIVLNRKLDLLTRGSGDILVGPSYEQIEIGIDESGNGKFKDAAYFAGLGFLIIPIAGFDIREIKFEKIDNKIKYTKCQN
jgi:hypothetical protein